MNKSFLRKSLVLLLYSLSSAIVLFIFIVRPGINGYSRAMFPDMVYGKAHRPFVYRALLPSAVRAITEATPDGVKEGIRLRVETRRSRMVEMLKWETEYMYEYIVALVLMFCCFLAFAYALRRLITLFYDYPSFVADLAPVGGLVALPFFFRYYSYVYDPCTLVLFTLALALIATRKHLLFYIIFVLACFNKETSILLIGLFLVHEFRIMRKLGLAGHLLLQVSLWAAVRAIIMTIFRNNPGSPVEFHLIRNLGLPGSPLKFIYFAAAVLIVSVLVRYGWAQKPVFLRTGLFVTLMPLALSAVFLGFVDELRCYYEAFPFLFLLSLPTVVDIFRSSYNAESTRSPTA